MKLCVAQTKPIKGDINQNIKNHKKLVSIAVANAVDIIIFPELSLTGYEPELAKELTTSLNDTRLQEFQNISNRDKVTIGVGMPTKNDSDILISMIIFQPYKERIVYSKQYLHPTEKTSFSNGKNSILLNFKNNKKLAFAICYELSIDEHSNLAYESGANVYIASVLNSIDGVDNDLKRLSYIAKKYGMITLMSNYVGQSGGYDCAGKTSIWNKKGELVGQLDNTHEGVLIFDTDTEFITEEYL